MRNYQVQGNLFAQESRLCEFLVVFQPPKIILDQVQIYKEEFDQLFGSFNSRVSATNVAVCDFLLFEHRTWDVYSLFRQRLESLPPFSVEISGFDTFSANNSIHLHIEVNEYYQSLLNELDITRKMMYLRKNYFQRNNPHITVARDIPDEVFPDAASVFLHRNFQSSFKIEQLQVLKFDLISRKYKHYGYLPLTGEHYAQAV